VERAKGAVWLLECGSAQGVDPAGPGPAFINSASFIRHKGAAAVVVINHAQIDTGEDVPFLPFDQSVVVEKFFTAKTELAPQTDNIIRSQGQLKLSATISKAWHPLMAVKVEDLLILNLLDVFWELR
jgi:hypothetical protein